MSKGLGKTERFTLQQLDALAPAMGIPLLALAHRYAEETQLPYSRGVIETVRRAIRSLERKGLASIELVNVSTATRGESRDMLLVGAPGYDELVPAVRVPPGSTTPLRQNTLKDRASRDRAGTLVLALAAAPRPQH